MFAQEHYDALRTRAGLLDRSQHGRLQLTGADRRAYLQGLLTNDIAALDAGQGCYAALLTPQGRMISDMRVSELGDRVLLDLSAATVDVVRRRLEDFIFSEDVAVEDLRDAMCHYGLYGPDAARILTGALTQGDCRSAGAGDLDRLPLGANVCGALGDAAVWVVRSDDFGVDGFEILTAASRGGDLARALADGGAAPVEEAAAEVTRVEAGRPRWGIDMDEDTIPLEAGIESRAISLTKGCYVGQEVIIRVLHRGQGRVARRLVGLAAAGDAASIQAGDQINAGDKRIGRVTSAVDSPRAGRRVALGYVQRDHAEPGHSVTVGTAAGPASATVSALPFTRSAGG
jgi:tRNA-modifying protein YgfZ